MVDYNESDSDDDPHFIHPRVSESDGERNGAEDDKIKKKKGLGSRGRVKKKKEKKSSEGHDGEDASSVGEILGVKVRFRSELQFHMPNIFFGLFSCCFQLSQSKFQPEITC